MCCELAAWHRDAYCLRVHPNVELPDLPGHRWSALSHIRERLERRFGSVVMRKYGRPLVAPQTPSVRRSCRSSRDGPRNHPQARRDPRHCCFARWFPAMPSPFPDRDMRRTNQTKRKLTGQCSRAPPSLHVSRSHISYPARKNQPFSPNRYFPLQTALGRQRDRQTNCARQTKRQTDKQLPRVLQL